MRFLVVGLGSIGSRHAANAAALPGVELGVVDPAPGLAEGIGARLGARCFAGWDAALAWRPEAAVVAVPNSAHVPVALDLVRAGAHVLVEKPISHALDGLDAFLDEAGALGRSVFTVCNMRFHPAIKAVREALPHVGRVLFARAHYGNYLPDMRPGADYRRLYCARRDMGGGVIFDAIHEADYLAWLLGPVRSVICDKATLSDLEIDVEDYAALVMRHQGGARSELHLDYLRRFKRRGLEVVGTEGSVVWQSEGKAPEHCTVRRHRVGGGWETIFEDEALDASGMYRELLERFVLAVRGGGGHDLLGGRQARDALACVLAAHRAADRGRNTTIDATGLVE